MKALIGILLISGFSLVVQDIPLSPQAGGKSVSLNLLKEGDILFSTTGALVSDLIRRGTSGPISHVCIVTDVLKQGNNTLVFVVESVKPKVRKVGYDEYSRDATVIVAFRHPKATQAQRAKLITWLNQQAQNGVPYNMWAAVTSAPKFEYLQKLKLVNFGNSEGTFCSKLVIDAYKQTDIDLAKLTPGQNWDPNSLATLHWFNDLDYIGHLKFNP